MVPCRMHFHIIISCPVHVHIRACSLTPCMYATKLYTYSNSVNVCLSPLLAFPMLCSIFITTDIDLMWMSHAVELAPVLVYIEYFIAIYQVLSVHQGQWSRPKITLAKEYEKWKFYELLTTVLEYFDLFL